jgi:hypothetical protein
MVQDSLSECHGASAGSHSLPWMNNEDLQNRTLEDVRERIDAQQA